MLLGLEEVQEVLPDLAAWADWCAGLHGKIKIDLNALNSMQLSGYDTGNRVQGECKFWAGIGGARLNSSPFDDLQIPRLCHRETLGAFLPLRV